MNRINYLFDVARFPYHFWGIVNNDHSIYHNPGIHISSYLTLHTSKFLIDPPKEVLESATECRAFLNDLKNLEFIINHLKNEFKTSLELFEIQQNNQPLYNLLNKSKEILSQIPSSLDEIKNEPFVVDVTDFTVQVFLQKLIDLKLIFDQIHEMNVIEQDKA